MSRALSSSAASCSSVSGFPDSAPNRRSLSGSTIGCLSGWPGVGGTCWASRSVARPPSCEMPAETRGVPACAYHRRKRDRSTPPASSMQATKSSHVAAVPSKRAK